MASDSEKQIEEEELLCFSEPVRLFFGFALLGDERRDGEGGQGEFK